MAHKVRNSPPTNQSSSTTNAIQAAQSQPTNSTIVHLSSNTRKPTSVLLATAVVLIQSPSGCLIKVRTFLDQSSQSCFITSALANLLQLPKQRTNISVLGVGQYEAGTVHALVEHKVISNIDSSYRYSVQSLVLPSLTQLIPSQPIKRQDWPHIIGLPLADPDFEKPAPIDLILGVEIYSRILLNEVRYGPKGSPVAQATSLGWILSGHVANPFSVPTTTVSLHSSSAEINTLLRKFWETEEPPAVKHLTPEEVECEQFFQRTHYRNHEGRYVVSLPIKSTDTPLGFSRDAALSALLRMEHRFARDADLHQSYSEFISEYLNLHHMEVVPKEQIIGERSYYLPHHAILKPSSSTTKLRVVFNASQETSSGITLNDILHTGPKLQNDVFCILLKWRLFPYVLTADIEKMFRQILIDKSDADLQRILWRFSVADPIKCYRLLTVTYGTACAPYLACRVLKQLAEDYHQDYPAAAQVLTEHFYVDDALFGAYTQESALLLRDELRSLLQKGGFKLRKWLANSHALLQGIPEEDQENLTYFKLFSDAQIKALGISWDPTGDTFHFKLNMPSTVKCSKRSVLADISRIYDPLGWLSPIIIVGKIFLQKLWMAKLDWDDDLPPEMKENWLKYKSDIRHVNDIKINRWIGTESSQLTLELHGFCDASLSAYGAAVYLRVLHDVDYVITLLKRESVHLKQYCCQD